MKILLTGAGGFVGKNLLEILQGKYEIFSPGSRELDLTDTEAVREYLCKNNFDIVIHAANTNNTRRKDTDDYGVLSRNLRMFFNLERCKNYFGKMYYFGSGAEYDREHYISGMKESFFDSHVPKDSYGFSKYIMSKTCEKAENIYDLRLFGVYGKYEEWERRFISNAICRVLKGKDITLQCNVYFDYLWIRDLADIMDWFIGNEPNYHHYNVCSGNKIDLYSLACIVKKTLESNCDIVVAKPGWKLEYTGNNQRLLNEMGKYHFTGYGEAIQQLCSYYREIIDEIDESRLV